MNLTFYFSSTAKTLEVTTFDEHGLGQFPRDEKIGLAETFHSKVPMICITVSINSNFAIS